MKPCLVPRCPYIAVSRGRCAKHAREAAQQIRVGSLAKKVYNSKHWKVLSRSVLAEEQVCRVSPDHLASEVDHIVAIEDGGEPFDRDNLQALCHKHHAEKTQREVRARRF